MNGSALTYLSRGTGDHIQINDRAAPPLLCSDLPVIDAPNDLMVNLLSISKPLNGGKYTHVKNKML
jgi:hypothetical protein